MVGSRRSLVCLQNKRHRNTRSALQVWRSVQVLLQRVDALGENGADPEALIVYCQDKLSSDVKQIMFFRSLCRPLPLPSARILLLYVTCMLLPSSCFAIAVYKG